MNTKTLRIQHLELLFEPFSFFLSKSTTSKWLVCLSLSLGSYIYPSRRGWRGPIVWIPDSVWLCCAMRWELNEEKKSEHKDGKLTNKIGDPYRFQRYRSYVVPSLSWFIHTHPAMRLSPTTLPPSVEMML